MSFSRPAEQLQPWERVALSHEVCLRMLTFEEVHTLERHVCLTPPASVSWCFGQHPVHSVGIAASLSAVLPQLTDVRQGVQGTAEICLPCLGVRCIFAWMVPPWTNKCKYHISNYLNKQTRVQTRSKLILTTFCSAAVSLKSCYFIGQGWKEGIK